MSSNGNEVLIKDLLNRLHEYEDENRDLKIENNNLKKMLKNQQKSPSNSNKSSPNSSISVVGVGGTFGSVNDSYVDCEGLNICSKIESYLKETNEKLSNMTIGGPSQTLNDILTYPLIHKLCDIVLLQYGKNEIEMQKVNKLKEAFLLKFNFIDKQLSESFKLSDENQLLKEKMRELTIEINSIKASLDCKKLIECGKTSDLIEEFKEWKKNSLSIKNKIKEQNNFIKTLIELCDKKLLEEKLGQNAAFGFVDSSESRRMPNPIGFKPVPCTDDLNRDLTPSPSTSPTKGLANQFRQLMQKSDSDNLVSYENLDTITTDFIETYVIKINPNSENNRNNVNHIPVTVVNSAESNNTNRNVNDKLYECPKCNNKLLIETQIEFQQFQDHVKLCNNDSLVCMFCLKLFNKDKNDEFEAHINTHVEY